MLHTFSLVELESRVIHLTAGINVTVGFICADSAVDVSCGIDVVGTIVMKGVISLGENSRGVVARGKNCGL